MTINWGARMSDHNILSRRIKPAARKLGIGWVNWQVLRRSYATWLVEAAADPKALQAQMRHSRISTTMDVYSQFVPAAQRRAALTGRWVERGLLNIWASTRIIRLLEPHVRCRTPSQPAGARG